ncbi:MAG: anti-sigma factor domain-containing protein, partial [Pyrinomonadaceae bacterium]
MSKRRQVRWACAAAAAVALANLSHGGAAEAGGGGRARRGPAKAAAQAERVDIRLRSLTTRASGQLSVEASEGGGRARLTAMNLPDPRTVASGARVYVVWAVSGGRIVRLGELRRDERGNGGLAFARPEGFERFGVIVTAESSPEVERPGDPVLT